MNILFALTYYRPHISGLTIHIQRIAEALAARGHGVTVLTSRYRRDLATAEMAGGVRIERVPVWWRPGKGVVSPGVRGALGRLIPQHDVVVQSLPANPDAVWWSRVLARRHARPLALVYACAVRFEGGAIERAVESACRAAFTRAVRDADSILVLSADYAGHQHALSGARERTVAILPPIDMPVVSDEARQAFRDRWGFRDEHRHVLLAARMAAEKGVEHLLDALPIVGERLGATRLVVTGDQSQVIGERAYRERLHARLHACRLPVVFTGELDVPDLAACFAACDVTALPSVNETESFGMVQVESMLCGTPVVSSDLPGVRVPVMRTGMGVLVRPADPHALADGLVAVLRDREAYTLPRARIRQVFDCADAIDRTESWLAEVTSRHRGRRDQHRTRIEEFTAQAASLPAFRALVRAVETQLLRDESPLGRPSLDFGCGDGHFAGTLGHRFDAGVDADARALDEARHRRTHALLVRADGRVLPFGPASFQTVVANSTVEHIEHLDAALAEIARVLKPGGRLLATVPSHRFGTMLGVPSLAARVGLDGLARRYARWFNEHSQHHTIEAPVQWIERFDRHGFRLITWRYYLSPRAHAAFDLLHYVGLTNLVSRYLTGEWVAGPLRWTPALYTPTVAPLLEPTSPSREGPYALYVVERCAAS